MKEPVTLESLRDKMTFFNTMYDIVRIVDPVKKEVMDFRGEAPVSLHHHCYGFWKQGSFCENCISTRAHLLGATFMKMEQVDHELYMITALPVEAEGERLVLELLKNVTDTMLISLADDGDGRTTKVLIKEMNDRVIRDPLTGLYNRRYIQERLPAHIVSCVAHNKSAALVMADIDGFKQINDRFGHGAGDHLLRHICQVLQNSMPGENDWTARYGGDEFVIFLEGPEAEDAFAFIEALREKIEQTQTVYCDAALCVSCSFGIAALDPQNPPTPSALIDVADKKLYEAKNDGRNRVRL